jgi:hypothetical protein
MALVTASLSFWGIQPQQSFAMGSNGGVVQPEDAKKDTEHMEKGREGGKSGEGISTKETGSQIKEKNPPEKKPRIKYRDEPRCSC